MVDSAKTLEQPIGVVKMSELKSSVNAPQQISTTTFITSPSTLLENVQITQATGCQMVRITQRTPPTLASLFTSQSNPHKKRKIETSSETSQQNQSQQQQQQTPHVLQLASASTATIEHNKKRYYCRYCNQSWPISYFRNSQQFGAHCSNCSRKPSSPLIFPASPSSSIISAIANQKQAERRKLMESSLSVQIFDEPQTNKSSPTSSNSSSVIGTPVIVPTPISTLNSTPTKSGRIPSVSPEEDGACEMLIAMKSTPDSQQSQSQLQSSVKVIDSSIIATLTPAPIITTSPKSNNTIDNRSFIEIWESMTKDLDELRNRVSLAMSDIACMKACKTTGIPIPSSSIIRQQQQQQQFQFQFQFQQQPSNQQKRDIEDENDMKDIITILADFSSREQNVRASLNELIQQSASICCLVSQLQQQQQQQS